MIRLSHFWHLSLDLPCVHPLALHSHRPKIGIHGAAMATLCGQNLFSWYSFSFFWNPDIIKILHRLAGFYMLFIFCTNARTHKILQVLVYSRLQTAFSSVFLVTWLHRCTLLPSSLIPIASQNPSFQVKLILLFPQPPVFALEAVGYKVSPPVWCAAATDSIDWNPLKAWGCHLSVSRTSAGVLLRF